MNGAKGSGGRQQHMGVQEPYNGQKPQRSVECAGGAVCKWGVLMGNEGTDACHFRL
jgi:hypothetical protein